MNYRLVECQTSGREIPRDTMIPSSLHYSERVRYADMLERYLRVFPKDRVKVLLFDDLKADATKVILELWGYK